MSTRALGFRVSCAAALTSVGLLGCGAVRAADGEIGMNARAFLAECDKGVEFWCSNQIYAVDINDSLSQMAKNKQKTHCLPKKGDGTSDERNAKIVAAVRGWFARHPEEVAAKGDASGPILRAMEQLWPGPCPR